MALGLLRGARDHAGEPAKEAAGPQEAGLLSSAGPLDGGAFSTPWTTRFPVPMSAPRRLSRGELATQSILSDTVLCFPKRDSVSPSVPRHRKPAAGRGGLFGF